MILATICCRGGSKGVPGKNIRPLNGIPLIAHTIKSALACNLIDDLIISTDSEEIASIAKQYGAKVLFMRPPELATDTSSKWPVFIHAVESYEKITGNVVDLLVDLDVTVPLKTPEDIDNAIKMSLDDENAEVIITGYEPERNPYFNMMEILPNGYAEIVKKSDKPIVRRQDAPLIFSLTPAAYVIKKPAIYKFDHWSQAICKISPMPRERAIDIDTEYDFKLIEIIMNNN
jgi:N-acylneuraminate cytidylyltransferase/CMP-N,N'-diacetyllegionaminic acid synthase